MQHSMACSRAPARRAAPTLRRYALCLCCGDVWRALRLKEGSSAALHACVRTDSSTHAKAEVPRFFATYTFTYATQISRLVHPTELRSPLFRGRVPPLSAFATAQMGWLPSRSPEGSAKHARGRGCRVHCWLRRWQTIDGKCKAAGLLFVPTVAPGHSDLQVCLACQPADDAIPFDSAVRTVRTPRRPGEGRSGLLSYGRGIRKTSSSGRLARTPSEYPFGYRRGTGEYLR